MANEELVSAVKKIVSLARDGKLEEAYGGYRTLFSDPAFGAYEPSDQRQALRLMVLAKTGSDRKNPAVIEAHGAAVAPLTTLVSAYSEPADHEMLGICQLLLGDEAAASATFKAGLAIERERNPGSDLCGNLMKRVSLI